MLAAVRKQQPHMLSEFIEGNKEDFLMKTHVNTADLKLGEIIKQQEKAFDKLLEAANKADITMMEARIASALEIVSLRQNFEGRAQRDAPPMYGKHPKLVEMEGKLTQFLKEESQFKRKITKIIETEFKHANIEAFERVTQQIRVAPVASRLDLTQLVGVIEGFRTERERLEAKVTGAIQTAKRAEDPASEEVLGELEGVILEIESFKPMKGTVTLAKAFVNEVKNPGSP